MRINILKRIEIQLRILLKSISNEEELSFLLYNFSIFSNKSKLLLNPDTEKLSLDRQEIVNFMVICGFEAADHDILFSLKEESLTYFEGKQQRIGLIVRIRHLLSQINFSMNFYTRSFFILKQSLNNLMLYSFDNRCVETGEEPENPQIEVKTGENEKKKPFAAVQSKIDPKKAALQAKEEEEKKFNDVKKKNEFSKQLVIFSLKKINKIVKISLF